MPVFVTLNRGQSRFNLVFQVGSPNGYTLPFIGLQPLDSKQLFNRNPLPDQCVDQGFR